MAGAVHALVCLLGTGSWAAINGVWVELPLLVPSTPEGWLLPSCLTVIVQLANVGPLAVTLAHRLRPGGLNEVWVIYPLLGLGGLACLLLAFLWQETSVVGGHPRSTALLALLFLLALVDCTSSVTFLPYMRRLRPSFLSTYFIGEGLSGLLPGLLALGQGVGALRCVNVNGSQAGNNTGTGTGGLQAEYLEARFSIRAFFLFLAGMMAASLAAFILLNILPAARREQVQEAPRGQLREEGAGDAPTTVEERPMMGPAPAPHKGLPLGPRTYSWPQMGFVFGMLAWVNGLTNGVLPAVQSYSCLPYGAPVYHLSATLAALANPLACLLGMFLPNRSLMLLGGLSSAGSLLASYLLAMAALSPCPPLVHSPVGAGLIVVCWVLFVGLLSYVKLMIGAILRDEGHSALVWCGAVVQLGSMVGALTMFPLVSVYSLFRSGDACNTHCPS